MQTARNPGSLPGLRGRVQPCLRHQRQSVVGKSAGVAAGPAGAAIPVDSGAVRRVRLATTSGCKLGVSIYPEFAYNATGGGGWATCSEKEPGVIQATFDAEQVVIPALNWRTATLFGVPIPPPLNIEIIPERLEGTITTATGEALLEFDARFIFSIGPLYTAPPLVVRTRLTTGYTKGRFREGVGKPFRGTAGSLAGTATVEKTGDLFMDWFLMLPTDALAVMSADLEFQ